MKISYKQAKDSDDAFKRVEKAITPEEIAKFKVQATVNADAKNQQIIAQGKGFTLEFRFSETELEIDLKLSLLLKAFKGTILETLEKKVKKVV